MSEIKNPKILYEDEEMIVCVKPCGVPSQPDKSGDADMTRILHDICGSEIYVVHRLDRTVGGVTVYAKNSKAAAKLSEEFAQMPHKEYLAVVCGIAKEGKELVNWLLKNGKTNMSKTVNKNSPNAKEAKLSYEPVAFSEKGGIPLTLVRIKLFTGRHHQIRVQMANAGLPLYADTKYNPLFIRKRVSENIGLWSYRLALEINGKIQIFTYLPATSVFEIFAENMKEF